MVLEPEQGHCASLPESLSASTLALTSNSLGELPKALILDSLRCGAGMHVPAVALREEFVHVVMPGGGVFSWLMPCEQQNP